MTRFYDGEDRTGSARGVDVVTVGGPQASAESFDDFYLRTYGGLLVVARALVGASAEDVAQEAMLVAYRKWGQVQAMASPVAWVRRVCLNKAVSMRRRSLLERRVLRRAVVPDVVPEPGDATAATDRFWRLVRELPTRQAEAVALRYALDLPVLEVAEVMGCTEGTVKVHLTRARSSLAEMVDATGGGESGA